MRSRAPPHSSPSYLVLVPSTTNSFKTIHICHCVSRNLLINCICELQLTASPAHVIHLLLSSQKHTSPSVCKQNPIYPQFVQLAQSYRYCFAQYRSARSSSTASYSYKSVFQSIFLILSRSFASLFSSCIKGVFVRISSS